jgi:hypothetical protein
MSNHQSQNRLMNKGIKINGSNKENEKTMAIDHPFNPVNCFGFR